MGWDGSMHHFKHGFLTSSLVPLRWIQRGNPLLFPSHCRFRSRGFRLCRNNEVHEYMQSLAYWLVPPDALASLKPASIVRANTSGACQEVAVVSGPFGLDLVALLSRAWRRLILQSSAAEATHRAASRDGVRASRASVASIALALGASV